MIKVERVNEEEANVTVKGKLEDLMIETAMAVDKVCECINESQNNELKMKAYRAFIDSVIEKRSKTSESNKDDADSCDSEMARKASVALSIISQILKSREGDKE